MLRLSSVLVTGLLALLATACSSRDVPAAPGPSSSGSFSVADQDELSAVLSTAQAQHVWRAGCLWPAGTTRALSAAASQLQLPDIPGYRFSRREARSGAVMVIATRSGTTATTGSFDEVSGAGFLCYRPREIGHGSKQA